MGSLAEFTGRSYDLFEWYGDADAEFVIIVMGSASFTCKEVVDYLKK